MANLESIPSEAYEQELQQLETKVSHTKQLHKCAPSTCLRLNQHGVLQCKQNAPWPINNDDMVEADGTWNPRHDIAFLNVWNPALLHNG